jgi:hypothetical protein
MDIFMADLYLVPKETDSSATRLTVRFPGGGRNRLSFSRGIARFPLAEIGGHEKDWLVAQFNTDLEEIDISKYDFVLRNLEALTEPASDDFAVDVSSRDLEPDAFHILTESQRDFRYVTPVLIENLIYLVFVDWSDPQHKTLWISDLEGTDLRELNGTGDEPVFVMLGLPAARSDDDLERAALEYSFRFDQ